MKKRLECFGTATTQDVCLQCPDNEECVKKTMERKLFDDFPLKEGTYKEYVKSVDEWLARARKEILSE